MVTSSGVLVWKNHFLKHETILVGFMLDRKVTIQRLIDLWLSRRASFGVQAWFSDTRVKHVNMGSQVDDMEA